MAAEVVGQVMQHPEKLVVFVPWADAWTAEDEATDVRKAGELTGVPAANIVVVHDDAPDRPPSTAWRHYPTLSEWRQGPEAAGIRPAFVLLSAGAITERPPGYPWRDVAPAKWRVEPRGARKKPPSP